MSWKIIKLGLWGATVLSKETRVGPIAKVTFEQRLGSACFPFMC